MYDIAIIGAGPAGLSAAITARNRNKQVLVISNRVQENLLAKAHTITNYPGMPKVSGQTLLSEIEAQAKNLGAQIINERVTTVLPAGDYFSISAGSEAFQARTVILAIGKNSGKPFVGENEFVGRGVSHCATCDGMFFKNATVVVVGLSAEAPNEANFLNEIGAKVIYLSPKPAEGLSGSIDVRQGSVVEIKGDAMGVTEVLFKPKEAAGVHAPTSKTKKLESIVCSGVFILRPSIAPNMLVAGIQTKGGQILVNDKLETSVVGVFAAGDCLGEPLQIAKAVGEGQVACLNAINKLDLKASS